MRLESQQGTGQPAAGRFLAQLGQHGAMPEMQPIEITDSQCGWRKGGGINATDYAHWSQQGIQNGQF
ncbi:hypothetical protein GCM10010970_08980 [Silvimonas iriomotensis]|uniref:Uncharacterized protein n=1 Tax=Silvimonas iriomotensis TaxID=449662 RepID=A0ABQ2P697_9NEIS|nr:hypothetical protein GCM10010970_08980 [Silvimonas iriomotensis]